VLGHIEADGVLYRFEEPAADEYDVFRCEDGRRVGRVRGSPSSLWLLEAELIDAELLQLIVRSAIEQGFLPDLPSD